MRKIRAFTFDKLSGSERRRAQLMFLDASDGDGWLYELDIDGRVICRRRIGLLRR